MRWDIGIAAFGITAALLLIGGAVLLRFQRDRYHFRLMTTALEKGITAFPGAIPPWLISLRIGVVTLVLGLGLLGVGIALHRTAQFIDAPSMAPNVGEPVPFENQPGVLRDPQRPQPPRPDPALERWHRVQSQRLSGVGCICVGSILSLLGLVRIAFSRLERKYLTAADPSLTPSTNTSQNHS